MLVFDSLSQWSWAWIANVLTIVCGATMFLWAIVKDHTSMSMVEEIRHDRKFLVLGAILVAGGLMSLFPLLVISVLWAIDSLDG